MRWHGKHAGIVRSRVRVSASNKCLNRNSWKNRTLLIFFLKKDFFKSKNKVKKEKKVDRRVKRLVRGDREWSAVRVLGVYASVCGCVGGEDD